jgi:hypothetical protein
MCYKTLQTAFSVFITILTHIIYMSFYARIVASKICRYYISEYNVTHQTEAENTTDEKKRIFILVTILILNDSTSFLIYSFKSV